MSIWNFAKKLVEASSSKIKAGNDTEKTNFDEILTKLSSTNRNFFNAIPVKTMINTGATLFTVKRMFSINLDRITVS